MATNANSVANQARDLIAATAVSLVALAFYTSTATLLFQGVLLPYLPYGIGAITLGGSMLTLVASYKGSLPVASSGVDSATVPLLGALTLGIAAIVTPEAALPTVVVALLLVGVLVGLTWFTLGRFGGGDLIRNVPFPLAGGFLASTGWMMFTGGMGVSAGQYLKLLQVHEWLPQHFDLRVAIGLAIGFITLVVVKKRPQNFVLPVLVVGFFLLLHAGLWLAGYDIPTARAHGWLLMDFEPALPRWLLEPGIWSRVDWHAIGQQAGLIAVTLVVSTLSLLLALSSLEMLWEERSNPNRDLQFLGGANLLTGLLGGVQGGISVSRSIVNRKASESARTLGRVQALLCMAAMVIGSSAFSLVPRPLLGGLLTYMGLSMLYTWLVEGRKLLPGRDYAVMVALTATTVLFGLLVSASLGLLWCCLEFAVQSARQSPVRRILPRSAWPSSVERSQPEAQRLLAAGQGLQIVELQGPLFFGSTLKLRRTVDALLQQAPRPQRLLFELSHVSAVDLSAGQALLHIVRLAARAGVEVEVSTARRSVADGLARSGALGPPVRRVHDSAEAAVRAWDDEVLAQVALPPFDLEAWLRTQLPQGVDAQAVLSDFEPRRLAAGEVLFERGAPADAMYLVRSGRLETLLRGEDGSEVRLRTLQAGGCIGEMGLLRGGARSATVRAVEPTEVLRLGKARLEELQASHAERAAALYRLVIGQMAGRIDQLSAQVSGNA